MLAVYFAKMAPQKPTKFYLLNQDYNFGRACADGFKKAFNRIKAPNQSIVGEEYHPLQKVQDFGPYITKIMASGAEVVITGDWGQDLRLLLQQGKALGWKVKTGQYFLNDPVVLQSVKDAAVGHITADAYHMTLDTPENKAYLQEWRKHYPDAPINYKYPDLAVSRAVNANIWIGSWSTRACGLVSVEADQGMGGREVQGNLGRGGDARLRPPDADTGPRVGGPGAGQDPSRHPLLGHGLPVHRQAHPHLQGRPVGAA
jgi:branched-chain amino acid transport system substrate-binding protein